ncbi:MAG: hypothetical protein PHT34_00760 [Oscillospiraceae bacterium]|nr:hypothetical protein [Oscillospiraceae bacterium]
MPHIDDSVLREANRLNAKSCTFGFVSYQNDQECTPQAKKLKAQFGAMNSTAGSGSHSTWQSNAGTGAVNSVSGGNTGYGAYDAMNLTSDIRQSIANKYETSGLKNGLQRQSREASSHNALFGGYGSPESMRQGTGVNNSSTRPGAAGISSGGFNGAANSLSRSAQQAARQFGASSSSGSSGAENRNGASSSASSSLDRETDGSETKIF